MSDIPAEIANTVAAGKRKAQEPIEPTTVKRSVASSSSSKAIEPEDDSEQEENDLDEDLDYLETSNIIHSGRRTRGVKIDFSKVAQDDLLDDDDDDDDIAVPPEAGDEDDDDDDDNEEEEEEEGNDKTAVPEKKQGEVPSATDSKAAEESGEKGEKDA
ncbi:hypothetical protein BGZ50_008195 [Haplosporangium sp. Z 11]|nr:hypothetical protein BGZ50_008195 [Haplosporangium sp. Z 11]